MYTKTKVHLNKRSDFKGEPKSIKLNLYKIEYTSDGLKIKGCICEPKNIKRKLPVIIYCRGGNNKMKEEYGSLKIGTFINNPIIRTLMNEKK